MMKRSVLMLMVICSFVTVYGQQLPQMQQLVEEFSKRELIILVIEENTEIYDNFKKPGQKPFYQSAIKNYNSLIKEHAAEYFTYFKGIKFKTVDELAKMSALDRQKYYYLCYNVVGETAPTGNFYGKILPGEEDKFLSHYKKIYITEFGPRFARLEIIGKVFRKKKKKSNPEKELKRQYSSRPVYVRNLPYQIIDKWSMIFALRNLEVSFKDIKAGKLPWNFKDVSAAKGKTLLICKDDLHKKLPEEKVKTLYKGSYEVVSRDTFTKILEEKNDTYVYVLPIPTDAAVKASGGGATLTGLNYATELIDNASGRLIIKYISKSGIRPPALKRAYGTVND